MQAIHKGVVCTLYNIPNTVKVYDLASPCVAVVLLYNFKTKALFELAVLGKVRLLLMNKPPFLYDGLILYKNKNTSPPKKRSVIDLLFNLSATAVLVIVA